MEYHLGTCSCCLVDKIRLAAYLLQVTLMPYLQAQVPLPVMSPEASKLLDSMGLLFSASNELWTRLVRYWKQFLWHHQHAADQDADLVETAVSKVYCLKLFLVLSDNMLSHKLCL